MQHCDILIIGGGIAGASLAWRLAPFGTVILLEMESAPGYHATGRSATHVNLSVGKAEVQQLTRQSLAFFRSQPAGFSATPLVSPVPSLTVASASQRAALQACLQDLQALGAQPVLLDAVELRRMVPILRTGSDGLEAGVFDPEGYRIDGNALLQGYLGGMRRHGGQLLAASSALDGEYAGGAWRVRTARGSFAAPVLVNAAGAWADALARTCGVQPLGLRPLRRSVVTFNLPDGIDARGWPFVKCAQERFYFVAEAGGLLLSPADEHPSPPTDAQPEELDIAIAIDRFEAVTEVKVSRVTSRWAGLRTFVRDRLPVVGFAPDAPGFFWLAGQGGAGLQTSPALSAAAAALIEPQIDGGDYAIARLSPQRLHAPVAAGAADW
jgi:D-arginine dehydrogenase